MLAATLLPLGERLADAPLFSSTNGLLVLAKLVEHLVSQL